MTFSEKIPIFEKKISDDHFFSHRPRFSNFPSLFPDFPDLYLVRYRKQPFPRKKTPFFPFLQQKILLLLKILGGTNAWAVSPPQTLRVVRPPQSAPALNVQVL